MRAEMIHREMERERKVSATTKERKKEKSIDRVKTREKKKFPDPNFHRALLRFSASRKRTGGGREDRRRARLPRSSSSQTKSTLFKKKVNISLSPCTRLAPKSLCARSSASPASSILKRRCSCLVPTPAPSPKRRWPRTVESFPRWRRCFCVA